jgi:hypothetical protein
LAFHRGDVLAADDVVVPGLVADWGTGLSRSGEDGHRPLLCAGPARTAFARCEAGHTNELKAQRIYAKVAATLHH